MKRAITYVVFADLIFILLLTVSGMLDGAISDVIYILAFILPTALVLGISKRSKMEITPPPLNLSRRSTLSFLPTVAPTLLLIFLVSALTSYILSFVSEAELADVSGNIWIVLLKHALLTALCEELLFRYLPIAVISPYSKRVAVIFSAVMFSLSHVTLYQIPYAFIAGLIFCALDLAYDSILPSFILHLLNNVVSVFWLRHFGSVTFRTAYISALAAVALISIAAILIYKRKYIDLYKKATERGEREPMPYTVWLFALMSLAIASINL